MKKLRLFSCLAFILIFLVFFCSNYQNSSAASLLPTPDTIVPPDTKSSSWTTNSNYLTYWQKLLDDNNNPSLDNLGISSVDTPIDSKYAFSPILTSNTKYYIYNSDGSKSQLTTGGTKLVRSNDGPTKFLITNVGHYGGHNVDIIYTLYAPIDKLGKDSVNVSGTTQRLTLAAVGNDDKFMYTDMEYLKSGTYINNSVEYIDSNTGEPIKNISGTLNHGKLSFRKAIYMDPDIFQGARIPTASTTIRVPNSNQQKPDGKYRDLYNINSYKNGSLFVSANSDLGNDYTYNNYSELYTAPEGKTNITFFIIQNPAYYSVWPLSVSPILLPSPEVEGTTNNNANGNNNITWNVIQSFPSQPTDTYLNNYVLHFKIPSDLDPNSVNLDIKNSAGTSVTNSFNIEKQNDGNYNITAKDLTTLVNKQYTFQFTGSITQDQLSNNDFLNKYLDSSSSDPYYIKMNGEAYATYGLKGNNYTTTTDDGKATTSADSKMAINSYKVDPSITGSMTAGPYHVASKVSFSFAAQNGNPDARWGELTFKVKIPDGLNIDLSSLKLKLGNNASYVVPSSQYNYDSSSRTLTVNSNSGSWIGTGSEILTYDTTIDSSARGSTISETDVSVGGIDQNVFVKPGDTKPTASTTYSSTPFDVEKDSFPSVPDFKKGVENATEASRGDGKNRINDVLNFTLTAQNKGKVKYSKWGPIIFKDVIPKGLNIDKDSLKLKLNDGTTQSPTNATYNKNSDGSTILTLDTTTNLSEGDSLTLSYNATIDPLAGDPSSGLSLLVNKASASGKDINGFADGNYGANITKTDSQTIAVEPNILKPKFTNQLKKDNDTDDSYSNTVTARYGETIDYKLIFKAEANGRSFKGGSFKGSLPKGLSLVSDGVDVNYKNLDSITDLKQIDSGQSVTITFKVKITQETPSEIQYLPSILETDDDTPINANVSTIEPQDWLGFEEVPSDIDFGTHTPFSITNINNIKTVGNLNIMNYTNSPYYQISVSYDPLGDTAIKNGDNILQAVDS